MLRRSLVLCALVLGVTATADARPSKVKPKAKTATAIATRSHVRSNATSPSFKVCTTVKAKGKGKSKKRCSYLKQFQGHGVVAAELRKDTLDHPSGDVWIYAENLNEEVRTNIYKPDGSYDDEALGQLDVLFRCKRTGEIRSVDPRLYEQLSRIYDHFGDKRVVLVSGFRFAERDSSRHYHASAMDIKIPEVSIKDMYAYAQSLDQGGHGSMGIGIYPHSGFIHVDFRAPGDPSYRWTDYSGHSSGKLKKHKQVPGRNARAKKPTS